MARSSKPWYWTERQGWYAVIRGKRTLLCKDPGTKTEARKILKRLLEATEDGGTPRAETLDLRMLIGIFLENRERECSETTVAWYRGFLLKFVAHIGSIPIADLRPKHLDAWLAKVSAKWAPSSKRGAITAIKAMSSWSFQMGYFTSDPLRSFKRPRMARRKAIAPEAVPAIFESAGDQNFEDVLVALFESGCRPGEVFKVEAKHVDLEAGTWTMHGKTTNRTGEDRVIYLSPKLLEITRRLVAQHPTGVLFRNSHGGAWTRNAVRCRFRRREAKLGKVQAYGFRHLYATDALASGTPVAAVAALMGHKDLKMLQDHYSHMGERTKLLREHAAKIRGGSEPSTPAATDSETKTDFDVDPIEGTADAGWF